MTNANQQLQKEKILLQKQAKEKDAQQTELLKKVKYILFNFLEKTKKLDQARTKGKLSVKLSSHI